MAAFPFTKLWPGGNPTVLLDLRAQGGDGADLAAIAATLMQEPYLGGEQVGFLFPPTRHGSRGRLEMMGGELCINATRAAARVLAGQERMFSFEASGLDAPVLAEVADDSVTLSFDCPVKVTPLDAAGRLDFVELPGIAHFVVDGPLGDEAQARLERLLDQSPLAAPYDAVGLIGAWISGAGLSIDPLVHVRSTGSWIRETACGSGSLAALASIKGEGACGISQPSGNTVDVSWSRPATEFRGPVRLLARGEVLMPLISPPAALVQ